MFIDSHIHLDFAEFDLDRDQLVRQAKECGVDHFIIPGISRQNWQRQIDVQTKVYKSSLAFGIHPYFLDDFQQGDIQLLQENVETYKPVAIGECGVDGFVAKNKDNLQLQKEVFLSQIELANAFNLPLIVHHRQSHHHIFESFKKLKPNNGGFIHAFSGSVQDANKYIELGFKLGIGGVITYPSGKKTLETIKQVGIEHCVLETDAPDMPLSNTRYPEKPYRNIPANIEKVATKLAKELELTVEEVAKVTSGNVKQILNI